jgi:molybdenum cofactor guanylyltransferase
MMSALRPRIPREEITGLILAGGQGSRMGGVDKGLQLLRGRPLVEHAIERLQAQVGSLAISANRNLEVYRGYGFPVWPDAPVNTPVSASTNSPMNAPVSAPVNSPMNAPVGAPTNSSMNAPVSVSTNAPVDRFAGPLAGIATGLAAAHTDWLLIVPCDAPLFPLDLADKFVEALVVSTADLAFAATTEADGRRQRHPVFALIPTRLGASAANQLAGEVGKLGAWYAHHNAVEVGFCDSRAFYNTNTLLELQALER